MTRPYYDRNNVIFIAGIPTATSSHIQSPKTTITTPKWYHPFASLGNRICPITHRSIFTTQKNRVTKAYIIFVPHDADQRRDNGAVDKRDPGSARCPAEVLVTSRVELYEIKRIVS